LDESLLVTLGLVVGVALLYFGGRIRSRSRSLRPPRPPKPGGGE
jgi:hypothetical protein